MVKVGVAGVGHLGQHHARIFNSIKNCELVGVYDRDAERAALIAEKNNVKAFNSFEELLSKIDAVDIAATTTVHYELAKIALEQHKHVFIEKPITSELWQANELCELAEKNNCKLQIGHIERFNPVVLEVADEIDSPMFIESHRLAPFTPRGSDVPVVLDLMIHDIDLILTFVKSDLLNVHASGVSILTPSIDIANARLEFANGAIANVTSSRVSMKRERKLRFFQKDAYISMDFNEKKVNILRKSPRIYELLPAILAGKSDFDPSELVDTKTIDASDYSKDALTMELESFVNSINNNTEPKVDGKAGTRALKIATEIVNQITSKMDKFKQDKAFASFI
ncbi:MAG: Gfo/Idh/MocA family oxidoreductase [Candidatus Cloacimonetes bacterium]|nr:Gfo/Idh/MocA family oxidoreductase [Candidatus Cloacimonadota bacterium]